MIIQKYICLLAILLLSQQGNSQTFDGRTYGSNSSSSSSDSMSDDFENYDTTIVYKSIPFANEDWRAYKDTSLHSLLQWYDPVDRQSIPYQNLVNIGSPAYTVLFDQAVSPGFDLGIHAFDIYKKKKGSLAFFKSRVALTELSYTQGLANQNDGHISAKFGKSFKNNLLFALDYQRIFQTQENRSIFGTVDYTAQRSRHSSLSLGFWLADDSKKYNFIATFSTNIARHQDTGGLVEDVQARVDEAGTASSVDVLLSSALTREDNTVLSLRQYYRPFGSGDSLSFRFDLMQDVELSTQRYKFIDEFSTSDTNTSFYGNFNTDARGIRNIVRVATLKSDLWLNFTAGSQRSPIALSAGLGIARQGINMDEITEKIYNLYALGKASYQLKQNLLLSGNTKIFLADRAGNYDLKGKLEVNLNKLGKLEVGIETGRAAVPWMAERLVLNRSSFWSNSFSAVFRNVQWAEYQSTKLHSKVGLRAVLINNYLYFNEAGQPMQAENSVNSFQLYAHTDQRFWIFGMHAELYSQTLSDDAILQLPKLFGRGTFFVEGRIFKKRILYHLGVDAQYFGAYQAPRYQPVLGTYVVNNADPLAANLRIHPYLSLKIDSFRFFLKRENMLSSLSGEVNYLGNYFPVYDAYMRLGITWSMMD